MVMQILRGIRNCAQTFRCRLLLAALLPAVAASVEAQQPSRSEVLWKKLEPFAQPPEEFAGKFGKYRSPLKFADASVVKLPADWPAPSQ